MNRIPDEEPPQLSVVAPLFDEAANVLDLHRRVLSVLDGLGLSYELVLVDDGSRDATPDLLERLAVRDSRVRVVTLSRNFGHQAAVTAGLDHARGDAVAILDGDLQDPPEVLPTFVERWREGFDVVYAVRTKRKENAFKRAGYFLFYRVLRLLADHDIPLDSGDFCLMDRKVVDALRRLPERERFVRGLRSFVGFRQTGVVYERSARAAGASKYSLTKLAGLAIDGIVNFSSLPLKLVFVMGVLVLAMGVLGATGCIAVALAGVNEVSGWACVLPALLTIGGGQLAALGLVGEYVRRIFLEVKGRPTYIVNEVRPIAEARTTPRRAKVG
jgi:glycosyltransferase involved in cell wall biosynthesis